ncbi:MAG TPA: phosphoribosyltransferase family protein [Acidobacteriaceae bacterium]
MIFENREEAGRRLAEQLADFAGRPDAIVLGIPRGGVVVAAAIAQALHLPLDVFLSHKLGVPGREELAFGAIAAGSASPYLDSQILREAQISAEDVERVTTEVRKLLNQRALLYQGGRPPVSLPQRAVLLVDDGIATGASVYAAIRALRQSQPVELVVCAPVAPATTCNWLRRLVDRLICLSTPADFMAVGQFYRNFPQMEDAEIMELLRG